MRGFHLLVTQVFGLVGLYLLFGNKVTGAFALVFAFANFILELL